jgi:hypothetical protein
MANAAALLMQWLVLMAVYLTLAGNVAPAEWLAGAVAASLALGLMTAMRRVGRPFAAMPAEAFRRLPGWLAAMAGDVTKCTAGLIRGARPCGRFVADPFEPEPASAAARSRRALALFGGSLAPNGYVVALDHPRRRLVRHEWLPRREDDPA